MGGRQMLFCGFLSELRKQLADVMMSVMSGREVTEKINLIMSLQVLHNILVLEVQPNENENP